MNYFELFEIEPTYEIEKKVLEEKYILLQKKYHPDNAEDIDQQLEMVQLTIQVNDAYNILKNKTSLIIYYLKQKGYNLTDARIQSNLESYELMSLLDLQEKVIEGELKKTEFREILTHKISTIIIILTKAIEEGNEDKIEHELSKLIFFDKSLKHI